MLKDELERIIDGICGEFLRTKLVINPLWDDTNKETPIIEYLAQAIIDRLEIDKEKVMMVLGSELTSTQCEIIADGIKQHGHIGINGRDFITTAIAFAKPIRVKEGDK